MVVKWPFQKVGSFLTEQTLCPNVSTTPLRQWGFQQCLHFSWTTLRGKHCRHPIAIMGVVDTFGLCIDNIFRGSLCKIGSRNWCKNRVFKVLHKLCLLCLMIKVRPFKYLSQNPFRFTSDQRNWRKKNLGCLRPLISVHWFKMLHNKCSCQYYSKIQQTKIAVTKI